jgi:hypothetical protein
VHGIVYVPESEAPADPLESEGTEARNTSTKGSIALIIEDLSETTVRATHSSEG